MRNEQGGLAGKHRRVYKIWHGVVARCTNSKTKKYQEYGARGIGVCREWLDFPAFLAWALSNGYADDLSIDRIENAKGYEPGNCRWATSRTQANNRTNNECHEIKGVAATLPEWARRSGMNLQTLRSRIKSGWTLETALTKPTRRYA